MKDHNFFTIQGWMVNELGLKGNELLIYSIIYGFSQDGESEFTGSLKYLADATKTTKRNVMRTLNSLQEKGLIGKKEQFINGVKICHYYGQNVYRGMDKMSPNNNSLNNSIKENTLKSIKEKFQKPTLEEVKNYCQERKNNIDAEAFIDFYESKGWKVGNNKMEDWKACVRTWEKRERPNEKKSFKANEMQVKDNDLNAVATALFGKGK